MKRILFLVLGIGICCCFGVSPVLAANPHLSFEPSTGSYSAAFDIAVKIDTGGQATGGTDILIEYPTSLLNVDGVVSGGTFPFFYHLLQEDGRLRLTAGFPTDRAGESFTGVDALVATITFSPLGDGSAQVNFVCTPGYTTETNILEKTTAADIIDCASNVNGTYGLGGAAPESTPTPTPTPTNVPGSGTSPTPTPTTSSSGSSPTPTTSPGSGTGSGTGLTPTPSLPVTGSPIITLGLVGISIFTLLTGLVLLF